MKKANINPQRSRFRRVLILLSIIAVFSLIFCLSIVYYLFFSDLFRKSETLIVPDLTGVVLEDTLPRELAGFQTVRIACYDDAPAGTVLSQFPEAGSKQKAVKGRRYATLTLYVSKGRERTPVPHLIGKNIEDSACELLSHGFSYLYKERFDDAPRGTVIAQSPIGGTLFQKGESITLTVSLGQGSSRVRVPSLSGFTKTQAKSFIEASGLRIGSISYYPSSESSGKVISQFPLPGTTVAEGAAIALTVASPPEDDTDDRPQEDSSPDNSASTTTENDNSTEKTEPQADPKENSLEDLLDRLFERFNKQ